MVYVETIKGDHLSNIYLILITGYCYAKISSLREEIHMREETTLKSCLPCKFHPKNGDVVIDLTHFPAVNSSVLIIWMSPFIILGVSGVLILFILYRYCCTFYANSVDPEQMPQYVASDQG